MFNQSINPVTGNVEVTFLAKLTSLGTTTLKNINGTEYVVGGIEFVNAKGQLTQSSAHIFKKNLVDEVTGEIRMKVGETYSTRAAQTSQGTYISMSHLQALSFASADNFGFAKPKEEVQEFKNAPTSVVEPVVL